jgi:hypothetical protein
MGDHVFEAVLKQHPHDLPPPANVLYCSSDLHFAESKQVMKMFDTAKGSKRLILKTKSSDPPSGRAANLI